MKKMLCVLLFLASFVRAQELVPFKKDNKFGFRNGKTEVIPAQFQYACDFTRGLALVQSNGLWGYSDSLGRMKIPAVFQKAEPFNRKGFAYVKQNNQIGLIDTSGKFLIAPEYEKITEEWSKYYLDSKEGKGCFYPSTKRLVPAKYSQLEAVGPYLSGKTNTGKWDLYYEGKLIVEQINEPAKNVAYNQDLVHVNIGDRKGMYKSDKGWLFEPIYVAIEKVDYPKYTVDGKTYDFIYVLYSMENPDDYYLDQVETPARIQFASGDGKFISDHKFSTFTSFVVEPEVDCEVCLHAFDGQNAWVMNADLKLTSNYFASLRPHLQWFIGYRSDQYFILDSKLQKMDSFINVESYVQMEYDFSSEEGDFMKFTEVNNEPFLLVSREVENRVEKAVYELNEQKVISGWFPAESNMEVERTYLGNYTLYIFRDGSNKIGFFTHGMEAGTPQVYDTYLNMAGMLRVSASGENDAVYMLKDGIFTKLCEVISISGSKETISYGDGDPDTRTYINYEFREDFFYTYNRQRKFGLICSNGMVVGDFDTIMQNESNSYAVNTVKDGKYGTVNIYSGDEITPRSESPLVFEYAEGLIGSYVKMGEGPDGYFLTEKGQKFYSLNADLVIYKKKGLYGIKSPSYFDTTRLVTIIEPAYKSIEELWFQNTFIVKGKNKKYGVINQFGDTLVQFIYDQLWDKGYSSYGNEGTLLLTKVKGKYGVISISEGEKVPPMFDKVSEYTMSSYLYHIYEVEKDKQKGVYQTQTGFILPCEYEEVYSYGIGQNEYLFVGKRKGKSYTQYYTSHEMGVEKIGNAHGPYDLVSGSYGFVKQADGFLRYDAKTGMFLDITQTTDISYTNGNFILVNKGGKWGATDLDGNELIPLMYDSGQFMDSREEIMIGYENGVMYYIYVFENQRYNENEW